MRELGQPLLQCADGGFGGGEDFAGENRLGHALNLRGGPGIAYVGADFVGVLAHHAVYGGAAAPGRYGLRKSKERQEHSSSTASTRAKAGIDRRSLRAAAQPIDT